MKKLLKAWIPETHPLRLLWHRSKAFIAALIYGFPARRLTIIGVTGTDGKTTTVGMIAHILNRSGRKTGALSTAFFQTGTTIEWNPTQKTSPSPFLIQKFLRKCIAVRCTHVVLECSSHGLLQGRLNWTWPTIAAITNLSEEHLDYHGTMQEYLDAKKMLFQMLREKGTAILHESDRSFSALHQFISDKNRSEIVYDSAKGPRAALWLTDANTTQSGGSSARVHSQGESAQLQLTIPGIFNLENALCAIACAKALGIDAKKSADALRSFAGVPGRMERIDAGQDFAVYIDFTVTPESYRVTLSTLRSVLSPSARLLVLAGSCGDRMKEKRPIVGKLCSDYADIFVVTNEDPYTEDPEKIIDDVLAGVSPSMPIYRGTEAAKNADKLNKFCVRISERMEGIQYILRHARKGDIVLLCGKGSDITMMVGNGQVPWNERHLVKEELKKFTH